MEEIVISVKRLYKNFRLPNEKNNSVKGLFTSLFRSRNKGASTQHALKNISFDIKKGEFFGIVGRNGSGKSTMLKMLAGIYQPTKGSVSVAGRLVPFIELGVGFNPELTGRQNVYLNGALLGFSRKEIDEQYNDIVEFAELEDFMDQKLKNYSSGMQVRLAFSMAIRARADVLLIDEVLAVGDADFQRKCYEYFNQLKKDKATVVFVSHDMGAVTQYCDRAVLIDNSEVKKIGDANEIAEDYLKLFSTPSTPRKNKKPSEETRWGDGKALVENVRATADKRVLRVEYDVVAYEDISEIVAGFRVRRSDGKDVTGTNTKKQRYPIKDIVNGEKVRLEWEVPNIFSDGDYFIDPAIVYPDEITVLDWWDEATTVRIEKYPRIPYPVDPGFSVVVKR